MKLPIIINRHVAGASAILAALAVLGYGANTATPRRVVSLPESSISIAQQEPAQTNWNGNFLAQLKQIPPNAYGSARGSEESLGKRIKDGVAAIVPSMNSKSAQTDTKNWTAEDWRMAERAVAESRRGSKSANDTSANAHLDTVWQPPEEIAGRQANQSQ